jgi:hypothetical protein
MTVQRSKSASSPCISANLTRVAQHVGRNSRCRDSWPSGHSCSHSHLGRCRLDAHSHFLLLHVRLRCNYGDTDRPPGCTDFLQCRWQDGWNDHVVLRYARAVLHRLHCYVGECAYGLGILPRCRVSLFRVIYLSHWRLDSRLTRYRFWSKVNRFTHTPVNAVWLVVAFCTCLDLIGIGSTLTITAIFNITAPALDISYIAVIIAHRWYEGKVQFHPGPYTMGRWSKPINAIAVTWVVFISVVLFFPTIKPVKVANMNYAICVAAFIGLFSTVWWFAGARNTYVGPRTNDTIDMLPPEDPEEIFSDYDSP